MKRALKVICWLFLILLLVIAVCYIGIPSRLTNKNINKESFQRIKEATKILVLAQNKAQHDATKGLSQFLPFEYGRISNSNQINNLFPFLSDVDKNKIKALFGNNDIEEIDMHEQSCISYTIKKSLSNFFINSSSETLYLIFNNNCDCGCENKSYGRGDKFEKQTLGNGWFKVDIIVKRTPIQC